MVYCGLEVMMSEEKDMWIEYHRLQDLIKMERNPKLHSEKIKDSFARFGFVDPVLIDEGSGKLVAGHGRLEKLEEERDSGKPPPKRIKLDQNGAWCIPVIRGVTFESEEDAEEYGATANLLTVEGGFDEAELQRMVEEFDHDIIAAEAVLEADIAEIANEVEREIEHHDEEEFEVPEINEIGEQQPSEQNEREPTDSQEEQEEEKEPHEKKLDDQQIYDQLPFELEGVFKLSEEEYWLPEDDDFADQCIAGVNKKQGGGWITFPGANSIGIPNLRPDMLAETLPDDIKIWGDRLSTPDDGKSFYYYNYGACPHRGLPFDRTIFSFFTHDAHIETWWATPAYRVGQILVAGVKTIVVPDFSLWDFAPTAAHIWSLYRSAWLGRYFQEAGLKVIPRLEFFQEKSQQYCLMGIPFNPPIVATQFQTEFDQERVPIIERNLLDALDILKPGHLLIYAGKNGREMIDSFNLPVPTTVLRTSSEVRKKEARVKETDPHLLELRKRRRGRETKRATTPEK